MDGLASVATAMAVILSAIVRLIRTDAAWKAVDEGYAGVEHVRDLTGILDPRALQDVFGPPTMDGVYHVARADVLASRRLTGWLMGDIRLDLAAIGVAVLALLWPAYGPLYKLVQLALFAAAVYQLAGWGAALGLLNKRR